MPAQAFAYDTMRMLLLAECERLKRFQLPGRRLSVAAYMLPNPIDTTQMEELIVNLVNRLRGYDVVASYEGEALILFHPETKPEDAVIVAVRTKELMRESLAQVGVNADQLRIAVTGYPPVENDPQHLLDIVIKAVADLLPGEVKIVPASGA